MGNYLKIYLKKKIPLYVILFTIFLTIAMYCSGNIYIYTSDSIYGDVPAEVAFGSLSCFFLLFTACLPFIGMNYRYSLSKSDFYRQAPFANKTIRWIEHLFIFLGLLAAFTLSYIILTGAAGIRLAHEIQSGCDFEVYLISLLPLYFISVGLGLCQYFISYLLISRSNNLINSILMLFAGETILLSIISVFFGEINIFGQSTVVLPIAIMFDLFNSMIYGRKLNIANQFADYGLAITIALVMFFALAILGALAFFLEKDYSAEWAGKPQSPRPYQDIVFHAGFAVGGCFLFNFDNFNSFLGFFAIVLIIMFLVFYYTMNGLLNRSFKFKGYQWGLMAGTIGTSIILGIIVSFSMRRAAGF